MSQGPSCPNCGTPLRWFPQLSQWGCDRCQIMVAAQVLAPAPARSRNTLWIVLGAAAVIGGGVAVAVLTVGSRDASAPASSGSAGSAASGVPTSPCVPAAAQVAKIAGADKNPELATKLPPVVVERCDHDHWKPEVTTCLSSATGLSLITNCHRLLAPDQLKALRAQLDTTFAAKTPAAGVVANLLPLPADLPPPSTALPAGVKLGPPEPTEVGDFWLVPRSDGAYVIDSPIVTATFPSKPTIKVAKATTVNADGKPFDIYSFAIEQGTVLYQLQVIALGRNARDEGGFAKVEKELGKLGPVTKAHATVDGHEVMRFTVSQAGSTLVLDGVIDLPRGLLVNATTVTDPATRATGDAFLASVHLKTPPDPLDVADTLVGVRVRKAGKKLVAHDKTDAFTIEMPWQPTVVRTPDPTSKHDIEVAVTATKNKSTVAFVVAELSAWDALAKSPTKIAQLERDDLASMEKLAGGRVALTPMTIGGLPGSKIEPVGRAKTKVASYLVWNRFQHRMYRLVCLDQPCDAIAKSLKLSAPLPP